MPFWPLASSAAPRDSQSALGVVDVHCVALNAKSHCAGIIWWFGVLEGDTASSLGLALPDNDLVVTPKISVCQIAAACLCYKTRLATEQREFFRSIFVAKI